ncbi:UNVERIFIED_CONTAM: hypothetical protein K2H54_054693 [Gekko kuhli]
MGRNNKTNSAAKKTTPKSATTASSTVKSFFMQSPVPAVEASETNGLPEMATAAALQEDADTPTDELTISRQELVEIHKDLHRSLREAVEEIIQPINVQLADFMAELRETSKKADTNATICSTLQEEVRNLKNSDIETNARIIALENRWRQTNLKLRGFEEGAEENSDLATFISSWLAHVLQLEDGVAPAIARAYRLGPLARAARGRPRDILINFVYPRNGTQLTAYDAASGRDLLKSCGLQLTPEEERLLGT